MSSPIYLYTGCEDGERNEAIKILKASLKKQFGELEEYLFYAVETPVFEYMSILQNGSLFTSASCIVVKNAEVIKKKDDIEIILNWLSSYHSENSILILVSDEISIDSKLEKIIPSQNKKIFWEMFENKKIPWIKNFFYKNGCTIEDEAAGLILEMVENNTQILKQECSRFFICFPQKKLITSEDVEALLSDNREENVFSLFAIMSEYSLEPIVRLEKTLEILQKVRLSKENSPIMILSALSSCFRKLILWHKLCFSSKNDDFNLKINGFSGKKIKTQYSNAARVWNSMQCSKICALLASSDMEIRTNGTLLEDIILQKIIYEIIIKKGNSCSSYEFRI